MSWTIYVALAISTITYLQPVSIFMCRLYKIIKPRKGGYQIAAPENWVTPSVCLSVCPSEANRLPNYNAVGLNLIFYESP